ncbi:MAG TPA: Crp/Fnr family transcriptional regulator [Allosphingosinicella sp.]|nr:Crp/Fnr family transcriptional regulator [Allosphingosinicella sp.]
MPHHNALAGAIRKLASHSYLDPDDRAAILALPHSVRSIDTGTYLVREGDLAEYCCVIVSGFSYRHKVTGEGQRQILAIHMAGDAVDLHNLFLDISDHNIQALTRSEIAFVPCRAVRELVEVRPNVARAMWTETLIDGSIFREWVLNVGRRPAIGRIAHLLCEIGLRMEAAGLANAGSYEMPMTQEQMGDAAGLTSVHVNRVLQELGRLGLIERSKRTITIPDWEHLRRIGDFNARYLHLEPSEQAKRTAA